MEKEEHETLCTRIKKQNQQYLTIFENDLKAANLKPNTISNHLNNVDFYINVYLLRLEPLEMIAGCENEIDDFFVDFIIQKVMWSIPASIKSITASIKMFYKSMMEHGYIDQDRYKDLCNNIKESMPKWLATYKIYNNFANLVW